MPPAPADQKKILLVDDDKFLLDMYTLKFSKAGYDVKSADSADAALKVVRGGYIPDAMLVDIVMPGTDGLDLVATIRGERLLPPSSALMMLTNQGASDDIARSKKLGVDGYIVKATTIPSEVLAEVEKTLTSKKA